MEARVTRLEEDMREIRSDLKALRVDVAEIKGRMAHLPTVWQINLQMIGLIFTVMGGAFLIVKYGMH